ncbi:MAG: type IV pili methyl-accepting chemotaxis transducer N-terminal domain-containing protein, partial [Gammaproteobacteria bacterium]|nr:type IV pili methyl-accepting chemotaxis transducer N-terminal domain-containing protein [Gammaproteobacteria bacterium]
MGVVDAAQAQVLAMGDAINKAGRQRMLTQRMIKAYALAGMKLGDDAEHELH